MENHRADIADENGIVIIRNIEIQIIETSIDRFHRKIHGFFYLRGKYRGKIGVRGRYRLFLADGRSAEFLVKQTPPVWNHTAVLVEFVVSGSLD